MASSMRVDSRSKRGSNGLQQGQFQQLRDMEVTEVD